MLWNEIRKSHEVASYVGFDLKPKKGRLKIDSVRVLQQPGWIQDVIDIDTYGSPWKHWIAMLPNVTNSITVFLTIGNQNATAMSPGSHGGSILGFSFPKNTPSSISGSIAREFDVTYGLARSCKCCKIIEAVEAVSDGNARYIGVRLEPVNTKGPEVATPSRSKRKQVERKPAHV